MRKSWKYGILEDAVSRGSSNISLKKIQDDNGDYPVYGAKGVAKKISFFQQDREYLAIIKDGAGIGRVSRHPAHSSVLATMQYLIPNEGHNIQFVRYFLDHIDFNDFRTGSTIPHIYFKDYKDVDYPLISPAEQQRIVGILDEAFAGLATAKAKAEQNLQNARALFESHLQSVFSQRGEGWVETTLENALDQQPQNGWSPPAAHHSDSGTPVLTLSSVTGFQFRKDKIKFTTAETNPTRNYWVQDGDFLMTRSNTPELVGHVAIAEGIEQPTIYPDLIMKMTPAADRLIAKFLYYQMRTPELRVEIKTRAQGANPTMKKISNGRIKNLPIVLAPLDAQGSIVQTLDALTLETQRLATIYERKLAALEDLKKSLLHQAFNGEL